MGARACAAARPAGAGFGLAAAAYQLPRELRAFLTEQRALVRELGELISALRGIRQPVLLLADPHDTLIPARTIHQLATVLPNARVRLLDQISHHLPRRGRPRSRRRSLTFWRH